MRVAIIDTYYPAFLDEHYAGRSGLAARPYEEQLEALMTRAFGTSDAYSWNLRRLGHEAIDIVANCDQLQRAWAREHGRSRVLARAARLPTIVGRAARWEFLHRVVAAQIAAFEPDVVYCQDFFFLRADELDDLKERGVLAVGQCGSELPKDGRPERYDFITTSFPHFVERLRARGIDTEYFPIAFDERVTDRLSREGIDAGAATARAHGAVFVGGIHPPEVHRAGTPLLERLAEELDVEFWGYIRDGLDPDSPILRRHHGEAWGLEMYRILAATRVAINRHGDIAEGHANNMRLFEATGVGALLLTEAAANLDELFAPGAEVVAYESADDLIEKARHYLEREDEREAIAAAGQRRTLVEHTYGRRIGELAAMLEARLA
ncbi:MAG: glycosyltransferase family protein [Gaiellaceae bacterium]